MQGKELSNKFGAELRKAPRQAQDAYALHYKQAKTSSSATRKQGFMWAVLTHDFDAEVCKVVKETSYETTGSQVKEWVSWKAFNEAEGKDVVQVMIAQKRVEKRPHPALDPAAPSTLALGEARFQWRRIKDVESESAKENHTLKMSTGGSPQDATEPDEGPQPAPKQKTAVVALARKSHNMFSACLVEFKIKLAKFDNNECPR